MRSVLLALLVSSPALAQLANPPVRPTPVPFTETRHGITTQDPYRWMEDPERAPEMAAFMRTASDAAIGQLAKLPRRAEFARLADEASRAGVTFTDAQAIGDQLFYRRLDPSDPVPKLMVREGGVERVLFDPSAGGTNASIGVWTVSPDGRQIALHVADKDGEIGAIRFIDVASGRETRSRIEPAWSEFNLAWLTPTRIAYTVVDPTSRDPLQNMRAYVADAAGSTPIPVLGAGLAGAPAMDPAEFPIIDHEGRGDWVVGAATAARTNDRYFVTRRTDLAAGKPVWRVIASLDDEVNDVANGGDALYLLTTKHDSNGRVERLNPATLEREPIATPAGVVLTDLAATQDGLYIAGSTDGVSRLFFAPDGRGPAREIKLPFEASFVGLFSGLTTTVDRRGIVFALTGWATAPRSFRAEGGRLTSLGLDSVGWDRAGQFQIRRDEAVSADGTRVPLVVISPPGKGPWPTIVQGYGAYGIPTARPTYNAFRLSWTGGGGAMAYCGTRGGNERGRVWHQGGRLANKPNGHADYIACAERLVEIGVARPGGIAATGGSAGGQLAPVAVQKRPELFGALLPRVAVLNPSRNEARPNGANQYTEFGDPRTADGYRALVASDAYLSLATAKDLPDTLLTVGLNDARVAPWMSAKFAAAALDRFGDKRLVFVRADPEQGHGLGSVRDAQIAEYADAHAFAADRLEKNAR